MTRRCPRRQSNVHIAELDAPILAMPFSNAQPEPWRRLNVDELRAEGAHLGAREGGRPNGRARTAFLARGIQRGERAFNERGRVNSPDRLRFSKRASENRLRAPRASR